MVLLAQSKLKVLISKDLMDSIINHDEFVLINDMLKEYDKIEKEIKN